MVVVSGDHGEASYLCHDQVGDLAALADDDLETGAERLAAKAGDDEAGQGTAPVVKPDVKEAEVAVIVDQGLRGGEVSFGALLRGLADDEGEVEGLFEVAGSGEWIQKVATLCVSHAGLAEGAASLFLVGDDKTVEASHVTTREDDEVFGSSGGASTVDREVLEADPTLDGSLVPVGLVKVEQLVAEIGPPRGLKDVELRLNSRQTTIRVLGLVLIVGTVGHGCVLIFLQDIEPLVLCGDALDLGYYAILNAAYQVDIASGQALTAFRSYGCPKPGPLLDKAAIGTWLVLGSWLRHSVVGLEPNTRHDALPGMARQESKCLARVL